MNFEFFQAINNFAGQSAIFDKIMIGITDSVPYIAILLMLFLWFSPARPKKALAKQYSVIYTVSSVILALAANMIIHKAYYHARPFVTHHVHKLVPHAADSSFVSDHSVVVFAIAFTLLLRKDSWMYLAMIWAILVGVSRIYVGVHYPADVLGAAVLTFGTSLLVVGFAKFIEPFAKFVFRLYDKLAQHIPFLSNHNYYDQSSLKM